MALDNKLELTNSADLAREEERISKKKAVELFENGVLDSLPAGKFSTLQAIHKYLFEDIYDFAGKLRLLMDYTDHPRDVADPWYTEDFEATWQDVLDGCQGLLKEFMTERGDSNGTKR